MAAVVVVLLLMMVTMILLLLLLLLLSMMTVMSYHEGIGRFRAARLLSCSQARISWVPRHRRLMKDPMDKFKASTQRPQDPFMKEYTLNHRGGALVS